MNTTTAPLSRSAEPKVTLAGPTRRVGDEVLTSRFTGTEFELTGRCGRFTGRSADAVWEDYRAAHERAEGNGLTREVDGEILTATWNGDRRQFDLIGHRGTYAARSVDEVFLYYVMGEGLPLRAGDLVLQNYTDASYVGTVLRVSILGDWVCAVQWGDGVAEHTRFSEVAKITAEQAEAVQPRPIAQDGHRGSLRLSVIGKRKGQWYATCVCDRRMCTAQGLSVAGRPRAVAWFKTQEEARQHFAAHVAEYGPLPVEADAVAPAPTDGAADDAVEADPARAAAAIAREVARLRAQLAHAGVAAETPVGGSPATAAPTAPDSAGPTEPDSEPVWLLAGANARKRHRAAADGLGLCDFARESGLTLVATAEQIASTRECSTCRRVHKGGAAGATATAPQALVLAG
ncbi:hypothetical protein ACIF6L_34855 [Kitasatospora sp. NPDC086009]|uniref:hypothetical protein n=1 Tax=unclassified Kitasatospora TaxID=2633591 RepID=UPI0037C7927E